MTSGGINDIICLECGEKIGSYSWARVYGDGTARHHPKCHGAYRRRLNRRRDKETGRFK